MSCLKIPCGVVRAGFTVRNRRRTKTMSAPISAVELTNHSLTITAHIYNARLTSNIYSICENIYFCCSFRKAECPASIKSPTSNTNWPYPSNLGFYLRKAIMSNTLFFFRGALASNKAYHGDICNFGEPSAATSV